MAISSIFPLQKGGKRMPSNSKYLLSYSIGVLGVLTSPSAIVRRQKNSSQDPFQMETSGAGDAAFWISNAQLLHRLPGRITFKKSDVVFLISPPARLKDEQVFASFPSIRNFYTLQWRYTLEDCCIYRVILFQQMYDVGVRLLVTVSACYALK